MTKELNKRHYFISDKIEYKDSTIPGAGIGVFAKERIENLEVIEFSPVKLCHKDMLYEYGDTWLADYTFTWTDKYAAVVLGPGSFYNHNWDNNISYHLIDEPQGIEFIAIRCIEPGEELFNLYCLPEAASRLWFVPEFAARPEDENTRKPMEEINCPPDSRLGDRHKFKKNRGGSIKSCASPGFSRFYKMSSNVNTKVEESD